MFRGSSSRDVALKALELALLLSLVSAFIYYEVSYVSGIDDYISDECWYVSAARNMLSKYLNIAPSELVKGDIVRVTIELQRPINGSRYSMWVSEVKEFIKRLGGTVVKDDTYYSFNSEGNYLPAVCADVPRENISRITRAPHLRKYSIGYCYPNANGILDYVNAEHPPLVKYVLGLSILLLGDRPVSWRLPSILSGAVILVLAYLSVKLIIGNRVGGFLGIAAAATLALDTLFRSLSMVAMLDIYVSLFTIITYFCALNGRLGASLIPLSAAFASKFSGAFTGLPLFFHGLRRTRSLVFIVKLVAIPVIALTMISTPIILHDGLESWWENSVVGAISWHLSIKTTGGPPKSAPWEWLIGANPFPLHYIYDESSGQWIADIIAKGNIPLYLLALALSIFILPVVKELKDSGLTYTFTWGVFSMYVAIWLAGARTQYSFYMVQITPLLYVLLFIMAYYLTSPVSNAIYIARKWHRILRVAWLLLTGRARLKLTIVVSEGEGSRNNGL